MHPDFADWYRRVDIEPTSELLQNRWQAIEAFHENLGPSDLISATRVFFALGPKDEEFLSKYRAGFKAVDDTFTMRDNDAEIQVLAGTTLVRLCMEGGKWEVAAALAVVCGAAEGARKSPVPEIVKLTQDALRDRSARLRTDSGPTPPPDFNPAEEFQSLKELLNTGGANFQALNGPLPEVIQPLLQSVTLLTKWANQFSHTDDLRREESDVLWWLFGETSRDLGSKFSELPSPSATIVGAKELSDITRILPGPFGAEAFLHKMLELAHPKLTDSVSLAEATVACPEESLKGFVCSAGVETLCPVHLAAQKWLEAGGKKTAWHAPFQTASGLKPSTKFRPVALAMQTYRERLLNRAISSLKEEWGE